LENETALNRHRETAGLKFDRSALQDGLRQIPASVDIDGLGSAPVVIYWYPGIVWDGRPAVRVFYQRISLAAQSVFEGRFILVDNTFGYPRRVHGVWEQQRKSMRRFLLNDPVPMLYFSGGNPWKPEQMQEAAAEWEKQMGAAPMMVWYPGFEHWADVVK